MILRNDICCICGNQVGYLLLPDFIALFKDHWANEILISFLLFIDFENISVGAKPIRLPKAVILVKFLLFIRVS